MISHFSADELADYQAGSVSAGRAARIGAHLSGCGQCTQVSSDLASVSRLLASIPPPPMPDRVTERIQAALSFEASRRAAEPVIASGDRAGAATAARTTGADIPGRPDLPSRRNGRHLRVRRLRLPDWSSPLLLRALAATGALVLVVGGGILLVNSGGGHSGRHAAAGAPASAPVPGAGSRNAPQNSGISVGAAGAIKLPYRTRGGYAHANAVTSSADYSAANLPAGVRRAVSADANLGMAPAAGQPQVKPAIPTSRSSHNIGHFKVAQLERCLGIVAGRHAVLLAEVARYLGNPAVIVVLKPVNKMLDVVVAGPACGAGGGDVIRTLSVPQG